MQHQFIVGFTISGGQSGDAATSLLCRHEYAYSVLVHYLKHSLGHVGKKLVRHAAGEKGDTFAA